MQVWIILIRHWNACDNEYVLRKRTVTRLYFAFWNEFLKLGVLRHVNHKRIHVNIQVWSPRWTRPWNGCWTPYVSTDIWTTRSSPSRQTYVDLYQRLFSKMKITSYLFCVKIWRYNMYTSIRRRMFSVALQARLNDGVFFMSNLSWLRVCCFFPSSWTIKLVELIIILWIINC